MSDIEANQNLAKMITGNLLFLFRATQKFLKALLSVRWKPVFHCVLHFRYKSSLSILWNCCKNCAFLMMAAHSILYAL